MITNLLIANWGKFTFVGLFLLTLKICRLPKVKGWFGEKLVDRGLRNLNSNDYHAFHDLYLPRPDGKGTTQIDHLVVSRFGMFVIETKNYRGWIFGGEKQRQWTQSIYKSKHKFQNPLHQNALHINALTKYLAIDKKHCHNIVFFIGDCTFKTELPPNVMSKGLISFIKKQRDILLSDEQVFEAIDSILQSIDSADKRQVAKQHVESLRSNEKLGIRN